MDKKSIVTTVSPQTAEDIAKVTVQTPNIPLMYFNHARVAISNFDLRIFFGLANITAQGQQSITEQLSLALTPEFASTFIGSMKIAIERYEQMFGKIRDLQSTDMKPNTKDAETPKSHRNKPS